MYSTRNKSPSYGSPADSKWRSSEDREIKVTDLNIWPDRRPNSLLSLSMLDLFKILLKK